METTNFLNNVILGFQLKDILTIIAITLSIIALTFNTFDIKTKILNYTIKKKLDKLSEQAFIHLLSALYVYNGEISRDIFFNRDNDYSKIVIDNTYIDNMKKRFDKYESIYENSLLQNKNLQNQYLQYKKIYELCNKYSDNNILNKLLYHGDYGYSLSNELSNIIEKDIAEYLLINNKKNINHKNILKYISV